jgi:biotin transport system substrate-specific component
VDRTLGTPAVLVDRFWAPPTERSRAALRSVALVVGFALLTAALAQIEITLSFTPVPITGQTLGVLLAGGTLGWQLGASSQLLYWAFGLVGLPFYAGGDGGWKTGTGATMGYLVGFVVAAAVIGYLAERRQDRNLASSWSAMALGSIIIYTFGAVWLAHKLNVPVATGDTNALSLGVTPFLIGDLIKLILAGALLPAVWATVDRTK